MAIISWFRGPKREKDTPVQAPPTAPGQSFELIFGQRPSLGQNRPATKLVVIIGNCFAEGIEIGLSATPEATSSFRFFVAPLHLKPLDSPEVLEMLASASFVFVQAFLMNSIDKIRKQVPPECEITMFPDVVLRSVWPFDDYNGMRDPNIDANPDGPFKNHDGALAALRLTIPDKKKRFEAYRDLDFPAAKRVQTVIEAQSRHFEAVDGNSDAYLGRFVARHYKDMQLFYNSAHPSHILFRELCAFCMQKLGLPEGITVRGNIDSWKTWSVPVHPKIAQRLGLKWANEFTRYQYGTLGIVTWDQWVRSYIDIVDKQA